MGWVDREDHTQQIGQRVSEPGVGQFIPGPPALRHCDHQATTPQARQMARQACRDTPMVSARSAGYAGASTSDSITRARVGSDRACANRANTSAWVTANIHRRIQIPVYSQNHEPTWANSRHRFGILTQPAPLENTNR